MDVSSVRMPITIQTYALPLVVSSEKQAVSSQNGRAALAWNRVNPSINCDRHAFQRYYPPGSQGGHNFKGGEKPTRFWAVHNR
jgi:hypothetical protein